MIVGKKLIYLLLLVEAAALVLMAVEDVAAACYGDENNDENSREERIMSQEDDDDDDNGDEQDEMAAFDANGNPIGGGHNLPAELVPNSPHPDPLPEPSLTLTEGGVQLPEDCGKSGYDARDGQFPSYVQLYLKSNKSRRGTVELCGGTIITPYHILTAAHCTDSKIPTETLVGLGIGGVRAARLLGNVLKAEKHCDTKLYHIDNQNSLNKPFVIYDVAIIKLQQPITFTDKIQPACLPQSGQPLRRGQQAYSIGMGTTYKDPVTNVTSFANSLKVLPVTRVQCDLKEQHEALFCAQGNDPNYLAGKVCPGDSGGPVMSVDGHGRQTVYGLHSYGAGICMDYRSFKADNLNTRYFLMVKCADVLNIRNEIDKLLAECA